MEFTTLQLAVVLLQRRKKTRWEEKLLNGEEIGEADIGGYKYLDVDIVCFLGLDKRKKRKELGRWTQKQLIPGRVLIHRSNVIKIYIKCRCGGQGLISAEEC